MLRLLMLIILSFSMLGFAACSDPCEDLRVAVCKKKSRFRNPDYCRIIKGKGRVESLSATTCDRLLRHVKKQGR